MDIEANLVAFTDDLGPDARYASFDYCFNYFRSFRERDRTADIAAPRNLQMSCLQLGFYLASWGMLRGSSTLLRKSARHYEPVIDVIAAAPAEVWIVPPFRSSVVSAIARVPAVTLPRNSVPPDWLVMLESGVTPPTRPSKTVVASGMTMPSAKACVPSTVPRN